MSEQKVFDDIGKVRVLLVDDHPVVRRGLKAIINAESDLVVVAEASTGEEGVALYEKCMPDVTLMDLRLPSMSGAEAIEAIRKKDPAAKVMVLTSLYSDEDIFRAAEAGARGFLLKGTFELAVLEAIRAVHAGQRVIPAEVATRLAERVGSKSLSKREKEILVLVAKGLANKEIAQTLQLADDTVKNHLHRIFAKLDVDDRTEASIVALQRGIIELKS